MSGSSGPLRPIYRWGKGIDAPRLDPLTTADKCRTYRKRMRELHGENYKLIHEAQKRYIPGRQVVVDGQVVYQQ